MGSYTVAYILGSGHSGSTLLDLLLNTHPEVVGLGEIGTIDRHLPPRPDSPFPSLLDDPLWAGVRRCYERSGARFQDVRLHHPPWREALRWSDREVHAWAETNARVLGCVREVSGARILSDSSKTPQRLYLLQRSGRFRIKVIHLHREGRAVVHAYARKYGRFRTGFREWMGVSLAARALARRFAPSDWLEMSYEALCRNPKHALEQICGLLGTPFLEDMLAFRDVRYHGVGGNRMRFGTSDEIELDDRWRVESPLRYRLGFAVLGGRLLNRSRKT